MIVDTATGDADANGPVVKSSLSMDFGSADVEISGGLSKTFRISFDNPNEHYALPATTTGRGADYFQLVLRDDEAGLLRWVGNSTGSVTDEHSASTAGILKNLPLFGPIFQR